MNKPKFDHTKASLPEAIGVTEQEFEEIFEKFADAHDQAFEDGGKGLLRSQALEMMFDYTDDPGILVAMAFSFGRSVGRAEAQAMGLEQILGGLGGGEPGQA